MLISRAGTVYLLGAAALLAVGAAGVIESGVLALLVLLSPYIALAGLLLIPVLAVSRSRVLAVALLVVATMFAARFGGEWVSPPQAPASGQELAVATWNLDAYQRTGEAAVAMLRQQPADLVALEELTPWVADAIAADPTLRTMYPYQELRPSPDVTGLGILSRYPIGEPAYALEPTRLQARVQAPDGPITVITGHPFPAEFRTVAGIAVSYDPAERNAGLALLHDLVAGLEAQGQRVLLIGDFNTAPTEPAFARLTAGLHDAHAAAGIGPGWTWRPEPLDFLGIGLLRIDLVLSSDGIRPVSTGIHCPPVGDHCLYEATLALESG